MYCVPTLVQYYTEYAIWNQSINQLYTVELTINWTLNKPQNNNQMTQVYNIPFRLDVRLT